MRRALVIVAKAPRPGWSKTRLVPPLTHHQAAELATAFLLDTCTTGLALGWQQVSLVYPPHPPAEAELLARVLPAGVHAMPQRGSGLGQALAGAFADHFEADFQRVVLIAADTPDLPHTFLEDAERALEHADLAIGPSTDGGYYLLGLRSPQTGLFEGISWSSDRVYEQTLARAATCGLSVRALPSWADVDTPPDLARLWSALHTAPAEVAPRTRHALARIPTVAAPLADV